MTDKIDPSTVRFSKLQVLSPSDDDPLPLKPDDYPLRGETALFVKQNTYADAVVHGGDYQLFAVQKWLEDPLTGVTIEPAYPGDKDYWVQLEEVVDVQKKRRQEDSPSDLQTWPKIWDDKKTLKDIAAAVDGEYPASIQATFIEKVYQRFKEVNKIKNLEKKEKKDRIQRNLGQPFRSFNDFIGNQIRMGAINTWSFEKVAAANFMLKWNFGVPRPEEIAWMIKQETLAGVPEELEKKIHKMGHLEKPEDFTHYEQGSPNHPSFPAMHSAGSTVSLWLPVLYKITGEEYLEALRVDFAVSYARTVAGVHYPQDNLAGLNIGQRIIREELPEFVFKNYGYSKDKIKERVEFLSFDWNTFKSEAGTYTNCDGEEKSAIEHLKAFNEKFPEP